MVPRLGEQNPWRGTRRDGRQAFVMFGRISWDPRSFGGRFPCPRSAGVVRVGPGHGMEPPTEEARGLPIACSLYID